jgi:hypothetical protein
MLKRFLIYVFVFILIISAYPIYSWGFCWHLSFKTSLGKGNEIQQIAFSNDGKLLAAVAKLSCTVLSSETGKTVFTNSNLPGLKCRRIEFSDDDKNVLRLYVNGFVQISRALDGSSIWEFSADFPVSGGGFVHEVQESGITNSDFIYINGTHNEILLLSLHKDIKYKLHLPDQSVDVYECLKSTGDEYVIIDNNRNLFTYDSSGGVFSAVGKVSDLNPSWVTDAARREAIRLAMEKRHLNYSKKFYLSQRGSQYDTIFIDPVEGSKYSLDRVFIGNLITTYAISRVSDKIAVGDVTGQISIWVPPILRLE